MMPIKSLIRVCATSGLVLVALAASAQTGKKPAIPTAVGPVSMKAALGSFKLLGHSDEDPARGHFEVNFSGSLLVSGLASDARVTASGNVRLEYSDEKHNKRVYFGTGKVVVDGRIRSIQCFGRDIQGTFVGRGIFRLTGEFDKKSKTGEYWYGSPTDAKAERKPWGTYGMQVEVPEVHYGPATDTVPTPRKGGG